jgi:Ca2+:H+ antiporter
MNWLLLFIPITLAIEFLAPDSPTALFFCSAAAIVPLAGWLGTATEHLAERTTEGIGGLLNATFGNAAELIIALLALHKGLYGVVKASLTGSILGNLLLVTGASILAGGLRYKVQRFNAAGARIQATMMLLATVALVMPGAFHHLAGPRERANEASLSLWIGAVLLVTYAASLWFSLRTHKQFFTTPSSVPEEPDKPAPWSIGRSFLVLALSTALIAWMSEILVGSVGAAAERLGMTSIFVGVIVVAIVGNAAEHSTAVLSARDNRMDLALAISNGSSLQIALFVAPVLLIASRFLAPRPMDLVFTPAEVVAVVMAVLINAQICSDGESNWLEGAQMLAVYVIMGIVFYFLPETGMLSGHP